MEFLFVVLGLAALFSVIAAPFLAVAYSKLANSVEELRSQIARIEADVAAALRSEEPETKSSQTQDKKTVDGGTQAQDAIRHLVSEAPKSTAAIEATELNTTMAETAQPSDSVVSGPWDKAAQTSVPKQELGTDRKPESAGETETPRSSTPQNVVFTQDRIAAANAWLQENWFLAVSALSLALAGVFLVQYGVENGLLTPVWRVTGASVLGLALVASGEVVRRRFGDGDSEVGSNSSTVYLPSTFSGAGLVVLFVSALAAYHLYGLIGPGLSFTLLVLVAVVGVTLGWFYGPYLTLVGTIGATVAPFLVGGSSNSPELFYYYFALVAAVALAIDALRRWAWVSVLGLGGAFLASTIIFKQGAGDVHYLVFAFLMVVAAVIIPPLKLTPQHGGTTALEALLAPQNCKSWPEFPTRIAFGTISAATLAAFLVAMTETGSLEVWQSLACIISIFAMVVFWSRSGDALSDGALFALPALVAIIVAQQVEFGSLYSEFFWAPLRASALVFIGALISSIALWRGLFSGRFARVWSGGAAIAAASVVLLLEGVWQPARLLGNYVWAFHAMAVAALMVFGAIAVARLDGEERERASYFALSAAIMITFFVVVLFSQTALTLAIAALVFGAAYVDRMLNLRLLTFFVAGGVVAIGWRLVVDPGAIGARDMPYWEVFLNYGGSIAGLVGTWAALGPRRRWQTQIMATSAAWAAIAVFFTVILAKMFKDTYGIEGSKHWNLGLIAFVWLISSAVQLWRLKNGGVWMTRIRLGLAGIFGVIGLGAFSVTWILLSNMASGLDGTEIVRGPYIFDTLLVTVGLPAFLFAVISIRFTHLPLAVRQGAGWVSVVLASLNVGLAIRRFWHGDTLYRPVIFDFDGKLYSFDGELYSYTIAVLIGSGAMLYASFSRRPEATHLVVIAGISLVFITLANLLRLNETGLVNGPYILDSMMLTIVLPALVFAAISSRFTYLSAGVRQAVGWGSGALVSLYIGLEIRRLWHGDFLFSAELFDGELYSYTIAMLVGATCLLFVAFFRRSNGLRQVAVAGIALTIAKVFLVDMSGLNGLIRVASFLGLGLSMAGLAWVVRLMNAQWELPRPESTNSQKQD